MSKGSHECPKCGKQADYYEYQNNMHTRTLRNIECKHCKFKKTVCMDEVYYGNYWDKVVE